MEELLSYEEIEDVLNEINLENIPPEFIYSATIKTKNGDQICVSGFDFQKLFLKDKQNSEPNILEVHLVLKLKKLKEKSYEITQELFNNISLID